MNGRNNDEVAKLLAAMANGQVSDDSGVQQGSGNVEPARLAQARPAVQYPPTALASVAQSNPSSAVRELAPASSLYLKQTLIPILLTLGVICPTLGLMGHFVSRTSPYSVLAEWWFSIPFVVIGVSMLGLGIVMMVLVRNELIRRSS